MSAIGPGADIQLGAGTIAGAVVGGIVGLLALLGLGWFLIRRNRRQKEVAFDEKTVSHSIYQTVFLRAAK